MPETPSPVPVDLLLHPSWVAPVRPRALLERHSIAIAGGRIVAVVPREACAGFAAARELELDGHLVTPGLVNTHCHAAMSLLRGRAEGLPLEHWLEHEVWPAEARIVSAAMVGDGTRLAMAEMLCSGITTFSDMYFHPEVVADLADRSGMRAQVAIPLIGFPTSWASGVDDALHRGLALRDEWRDHERVHVAFGPHSVYTLAPADLERIAVLSEELDGPVQIHAHETAREVADCVAATGLRPLALLVRTGLAGPRLQAVHLTQVDDEDLGILVDHRIAALHCPRSNAKLGSGRSPVERMAAAGVTVAFGTDSAVANNVLDLIAEADFSMLGARERLPADEVPGAWDTFERLTLGGARALGLEDRIGTLEIGREADVVAFDLRAPRFLPVGDPITAILHGQGGRAVRHVWIAGEQRVRDGTTTGFEFADLARRAGHWAARLEENAP